MSHMLPEKCRCRECRASFSLTPIELRYYREEELPLPQYCRKCRNAVKDTFDQDKTAPGILRRVNS